MPYEDTRLKGYDPVTGKSIITNKKAKNVLEEAQVQKVDNLPLNTTQEFANDRDRLDALEEQASFNLGRYNTSADLITAHPTATSGQFAYVSETTSQWDWSVTLNQWVDSEKNIIDNYQMRPGTAVQDNIAIFGPNRSTLDSGYKFNDSGNTDKDVWSADKINTKVAQDVNTLQQAINNEATARGDADTTLQQHIDTESTNRANADTTLQQNINTVSAGKNVKNFYVSGGTNGSGIDTNNGLKPDNAINTLAKLNTLLGNTGEQAVFLPSQLSESTTFEQLNAEFVGLNASHKGMCGTSGTITSNNNASGSQTYAYLTLGAFVKTGAGYVSIYDTTINNSFTDSSNSTLDVWNSQFGAATPINVTGQGVKNFFNQRGGLFTVNNINAKVNVITNDFIAQFVLTAGLIAIRNCIVYIAQGTTFNIGASGATMLADGVKFLYPDNTPAKINIVSGCYYSLQNGCVFDYANSVIGGIDVSASYNGYFGSISVGKITLPQHTASTLLYLDSNKDIKSLPTASYPSLQEIAYIKGLQSAIQPQLDLKAPLDSPNFTGNATVPDQASNENSTKIANTKFVQTLINILKGSPTTSGDTLKELEDRIIYLENLLSTSADADNIVNTYNELLQIAQNFPEGSTILNELNKRVSFGTLTNRPSAIVANSGYVYIQTDGASNTGTVYISNGSIWVEVGYSKVQIDTLLATKQDLIIAGTSSDYYRGDKTMQPLNKAAVGLPNVDNTSDANKPVSIAGQAALDLKSDINSPTFTGDPKAPTPALGNNSNSIANTTWVQAIISLLKGSPTAAGDTLQELEARIQSLETLLSTAADVDGVVNQYSELLQICANFPESSNLLSELNKKVNSGNSSARPTAAISNAGFFWFDETGGFLSNGSAWVQMYSNKVDSEAYAKSVGVHDGGTSAQYVAADRSFKDFAAEVRNTLLTGYVKPTDARTQAVIEATDTILQALLKLDKKIAIWSASSEAGMLGLSQARLGDWCIRIETQPYVIYRLDTFPATDVNHWGIIGGAAGGGSQTPTTGGITAQKLINWTGANPQNAVNMVDGTTALFNGSTIYDSVNNAIQLTPNSVLNTSGQLYWDFAQQKNRTNTDFTRRNYKTTFQYRTANGSSPKGDGIYFYYLTKIVPTSGSQNTTGGYVLYLDEINNRIALYYDGTLVTTYSVATLADGSSHTVIFTVIDNVLSVSYDGVTLINSFLDTTNRPLDAGRYIGLGASNGASNFAQHLVYNLKIESLGTIDYANSSTGDIYTKLKSCLQGSSNIQIDFDDSTQTAIIKELRSLKSINGLLPNSLTGDIPLNTDYVPEGTNKYFTEQRGQDFIETRLKPGSNVTIQKQGNGDFIVAVPNLPQADLNPSVIKSRYESNSNTNAFTDTYKSKLDTLPQNLYTEVTYIKQQNETVFQPYVDIDISSIDLDNVLGIKLTGDYNFNANGYSLVYRLIDISGNPITASIYDWHNSYRLQNAATTEDRAVAASQGYIQYRGLTDNGVYPLSFDINLKYFTGKNYYIEGSGQCLDTATTYGTTTEISGTIKYTQKISKIRLYPNNTAVKLKGTFRLFTLTKNLPSDSAIESIYETQETVETVENQETTSKVAKVFGLGYAQIPTNYNYVFDTVFKNYDPVVIYSMRRTRSAYIGKCMKVRRTSDSATLDIGFLDDGSFDTVSLYDFVQTGDAEVQIWYDQSGNANDFVVYPTFSMPRVIRSGLLQLVNLKPVVHFLSTDSLMMSKALTNTINLKKTGYTIVNRQQLGATRARTITVDNLNGHYFTWNGRQSSLTDGVVSWQDYQNTTLYPQNQSGAGEAATATAINHSVVHSKNLMEIYRDGVLLGNKYVKPSIGNPHKFFLNGTGTYFTPEPSEVYHSEFIIMNGEATDTEIALWNSLTT